MSVSLPVIMTNFFSWNNPLGFSILCDIKQWTISGLKLKYFIVLAVS